MTMLDSTATALRVPHGDFALDQAHLAVVAFLARYSGRTLDAYRHDLRSFFQWAGDVGLVVLEATRPHIELYRASLEERGLAASTSDRRLSTVCGYYRFAHIDGRIAANLAQYVRRPKVSPCEGRGMDRGELGTFLFTAERVDRAHAALAVLLGLNGLRVSEACATNIEDLSFERGHRTLRILGKGNKPATIPIVPRTARTIDLAIGDRVRRRRLTPPRRPGTALGGHLGEMPRLDMCARSRTLRARQTRPEPSFGAASRPRVRRRSYVHAKLSSVTRSRSRATARWTSYGSGRRFADLSARTRVLCTRCCAISRRSASAALRASSGSTAPVGKS